MHVKRAAAAYSGQPRERLTATRAPRHAGEQAAECRPLRRRPGICRRGRRGGYVVFAYKRHWFWAASRAHGRAGPALLRGNRARARASCLCVKPPQSAKGAPTLILLFAFQPLYRNRARKERPKETCLTGADRQGQRARNCRVGLCIATSLAFEGSTNRGARGCNSRECTIFLNKKSAGPAADSPRAPSQLQRRKCVTACMYVR